MTCNYSVLYVKQPPNVQKALPELQAQKQVSQQSDELETQRQFQPEPESDADVDDGHDGQVKIINNISNWLRNIIIEIEIPF